MQAFLDWWNKPHQIDGLIRAGVAHFWFVTIHPFEDGNGRLGRALSEMTITISSNGARKDRVIIPNGFLGF